MGMLLSVCMLAGGVAAVSSAQTTAVADPVTSTCSSSQNPMGGSTPKNSNAGFTIFTTGDADLENSELEGSLAVGGSAYFGNGSTDYPIFHNDAGSGNYSLPTIDGDSTRVLLNEYDSTSTRRPHITSRSTNSDPGESGLAKLMTVASGSTFSQANSGTQYNPGGSAQPLVSDTNAWTGDSTGEGERFRTADGTSFSSLFPADQGISLLGGLDSSNANMSPTMSAGSQATAITLDPDRPNVVDLSAIPIDDGGTHKFSITWGTGVAPSSTGPLIIRVQKSDVKDGVVTLPSYVDKGSDTDNISYVLFDLSAITGAVTVVSQDNWSNPEPLRGSIYAPTADVTFPSGALEYEGQIIAHSFADKAVKDSQVEMHTNIFKGLVPGSCPVVSTTNLFLSKTVNGLTPSGDQRFTFDLDRVSAPSGAAAFTRQTAKNTNGSIVFTDIEQYDAPGDYVYKVTEESPGSGYEANSQTFYAQVTVTATGSVTATGGYYVSTAWFSDQGCTTPVSGTPAFHNIQVGGFSVAKKVDDQTGGLFDGSTEFTVGYSYVDSGGATVSGSLLVKAGEAANGPDNIPFGTKVTLTEKDPAPVSGAVWKASFDPSNTITIGSGSQSVMVVTLTNTLAPVQTNLPDTGGNAPLIWFSVLALSMLLAVGGGVASRRARRGSDPTR